MKVKRLLDSLAYCLLLGNTKDIETDYKKVMHAKREIPASNCPSFVENIFYAAGSVTDPIDREECASFRVMAEQLDEQAEKYENKVRREPTESRHAKYLRMGIRDGEWCRVDTDGVFEYRGRRYRIDPFEAQYQPVETEIGLLYGMDRILAAGAAREEFYDMNYNRVKVHPI